MSSIFWNASSVNSFFNNNNSSYNNFYTNLNETSMIKSGTYKKLVKSYLNEVKSTDNKTTANNTAASKSTTEKRNHYTYDKDGNRRTLVSSGVLDELTTHKTITTADGTITDKTENPVSQVASGAAVDEAV